MRAIALVSDAYGGRGGIAHYNRNFLRAICAYPSMDKVVVLPRFVTYKLEEIPDNIFFNSRAVGSKLKYLKECIKLLLFEERADLIICGHLHLLPFAYLLKLRHRCKIIPLIYGIEAWAPTSHRVVNYICSRLKVFISIRKLTAARFMEWAGINNSKFYYLPNCVDENQYHIAPIRQDLSKMLGLEDKRVVLTVGRMDLTEYPINRQPLDQRKGFDEILEILPELKKQVPNIAYLMVGDGGDKKRLEQKAKRLGVDDIVRFSGYVPDKEKADYYRLANVFAMPGSNSLFDRYPFRFVFLEALACGLPVVGCELMDESELNDSDARALIIQVNPNDKQSIIKGILAGLSRHNKNVLPEMKNYYSSSFQIELHSIIDDILGGIQ